MKGAPSQVSAFIRYQLVNASGTYITGEGTIGYCSGTLAEEIWIGYDEYRTHDECENIPMAIHSPITMLRCSGISKSYLLPHCSD